MGENRIKRLDLHTTQGDVGTLLREAQFVVRYSDDALRRPELAISLTMPPRPEGWRTPTLPPVLAMNLPEGFLLDRVVDRMRKVMQVDDMNLLAVTSSPAAGRVWASVPDDLSKRMPQPVALRDILAFQGTGDLFAELLEQFTATAISGVQPKVVVTDVTEFLATAKGVAKAAIKMPDLIVKAAGREYLDLAENEFICMSVARYAGLETPDFWLSDDRKLFVIRRFDVDGNRYLGFEDMAVLMGKQPSEKYSGSYGSIARAIGDFAAPGNRPSSLSALFRQVVLACIIRNGNAHLKNFGILYGDPVTAGTDARLSPAFDLICTTLYLPKDTLALSLASSRAWPDLPTLARFGEEACGLGNAQAIIDEVIGRVVEFRPENEDSEVWKKIRIVIEAAVRALATTKRSRAARFSC